MNESVQQRSPVARLLVLDRGLSPQWLIASVALPSDMLPAELDADG